MLNEHNFSLCFLLCFLLCRTMLNEHNNKMSSGYWFLCNRYLKYYFFLNLSLFTYDMSCFINLIEIAFGVMQNQRRGRSDNLVPSCFFYFSSVPFVFFVLLFCFFILICFYTFFCIFKLQYTYTLVCIRFLWNYEKGTRECLYFYNHVHSHCRKI